MLSWNEIRARAAGFAQEWQDAGRGRSKTHLFYRDFFAVFGVSVQRVASFEESVKRLGDRRGFIDLFWNGMLLVEQKSAGRDPRKAKAQALDYFPGLEQKELPRYLLLSDFQTFELHDLEEGDEIAFALAELPQHVERFGFILGVQRREFRDQDPVNIEASELMGRLYDALVASGHEGPGLELILVRIVFCLFADDTGIFEPRDSFLDYLEQRTSEDGSDVGEKVHHLFQVLNTPRSGRLRNLDVDLARFPYIAGELFREQVAVPSFDAAMRKCLLEACRFDWSCISPAIFGALFQSVMDRDQRRALGAHYTTEKNILKVIEPLFLDELRAEFERIMARNVSRRRSELRRFHQRLGEFRILDPACGCGNFLIIAYRELRELEIEVIRELRTASGAEEQRALDVAGLSRIDVDQFYGIETGAFATRIAETALWMMDHLMNNRLSLEFGETYTRIPLRKSSRIVQGDALEIDWADVLSPKECSYVLGNPPFVGAKYQSVQQREQVRRIAALGGSGGTLDYVAAWFVKAAAYVGRGTGRIGFVATNSISQGEQVGQLWPVLFERYRMAVAFAHRTFAWGSDARGKAHVHVVIVGLEKIDAIPRRRRLFSYAQVDGEPHESRHKALSAYLLGADSLQNPRIVVRKEAHPQNGMPLLVIGSKPIDGGHYIFTSEERDAFVQEEPGAEPLLRPFLGSREFLNGGDRWILALQEAPPEVLRRLPKVRERVAAVRAYRERSISESTRDLARTPTQYHVNVIPTEGYLAIPETSSGQRDYVPIGWLEPPVVPSNAINVLRNATLGDFALLTSAMHMSWLSHIGGRLKSDYRYSVGLVYNTFPLPRGGRRSLVGLESLAKAVLVARADHAGASLSDLYDAEFTPPALRKAHQRLDRAVDRLYRRTQFASNRERAEYLLGRYERLMAPLAGKENQARKRVTRE